MAEYIVSEPKETVLEGAAQVTETVLEEAARVTSEERERDYGHPLRNHERIADIWSVILGIRVSPSQVALCMAGTKIARLIETPDHRDSVVDLAGYARSYERIRLL